MSTLISLSTGKRNILFFLLTFHFILNLGAFTKEHWIIHLIYFRVHKCFTIAIVSQ